MEVCSKDGLPYRVLPNRRVEDELETIGYESYCLECEACIRNYCFVRTCMYMRNTREYRVYHIIDKSGSCHTPCHCHVEKFVCPS